MKRLPFVFVALVFSGCSSAPKPEQAKSPVSTAAPKVEYFHVDAATAGAVHGRVSFAGKRPTRKKIDVSEDPMCAKMHAAGLYDESVVLNPNGTLANVFVYVKQGLDGKTFEPSKEPVLIDQKGCRFGPRVLGIQTGQPLNVVNSDPVTHNIHPLAQVNRAWNQSQDPQTEPLKRRFLQREVMIKVKCNIHSWMRAWIGAVEHPYFAVSSQSDGSFELPNLPPGDYTIEAWHEVYGVQEQKITVKPSGKEEVSFTFKGE